MKTYLTHFECSACGTSYEASGYRTLCRCGKPLFARYDLEQAGRNLPRAALQQRGPCLWRYRELLPLDDDSAIVSLGEGMSPLLAAPRLASELGMAHVWVKDEGRLPTGTFKARGLSVAVSLAKRHGFRALAIPSAGNAAGALAAYAARAGMAAYVFMPEDAPAANKVECTAAGARLFLVRGLITDAGKIVAAGKDRYGWVDVSTLKEPGRLEGKKTMGYEVAEQLGWEVPDVIVYPTGGGTGLIGMWKAFDEMERLGWIGPKRPRMIAVQAAGCAPIVHAFEQGKAEAEPVLGAQTVAAGLRVPTALGDFLVLRAVRESGGAAVAVPDDAIVREIRTLHQTEGIFASPEGAAALAALRDLVRSGEVSKDERVVLFNTGSGLKYLEALTTAEVPAVTGIDDLKEHLGAG